MMSRTVAVLLALIWLPLTAYVMFGSAVFVVCAGERGRGAAGSG